MRVTDAQLAQQYIANMMRTRDQIGQLQAQISSGKRIQVPSDDPLAFSADLADQSRLSQTQQYVRNITQGLRYNTAVDTALNQAQTILSRIQELTLQAANGATTTEDRAQITIQIRQLNQQLVSVANSRSLNEYLFAGTKISQAPFTLGSGDTVTANGNSETRQLEVGAGQTVTLSIPPDQVFTGPRIDVFASISQLLSDLDANNLDGIKAGLGNLSTMMDQVSAARTRNGSLGEQLQLFDDNLGLTQQQVEQARGTNLDVDFIRVASELTQAQTVLQASSKAASSLFTDSLLTPP